MSKTDSLTYQPELIRLAYAMAVEPYKHHMLTDAIDQQMQQYYDHVSLGEKVAENLFSDIEVHFQNAVSMLETQGRLSDTRLASIKCIEKDPKPVVLVNGMGKVVLTNPAGMDEYGWQKDVSLCKDQFPSNSFSQFEQCLKRLTDFDPDRAICVLRIYDMQSDKTSPYVMTKALGSDGEALARLSSVNLSWLPDVAFHFQENFGLTPIELRITQAVVTSQSLRDLAKERGRSLGTLRNQLKNLLAKLGLSSQTELTCLYSGYVQLTKNDGHDLYEHHFRSTPWRRQKMFVAKDGFEIDYSEVGPSSGRPILFFHPMILGTSVSESIRQELIKRDIRLIMPWRPGFAKTSLTPSKSQALLQFATYCKELLDTLNVGQVQIVGENTGMIAAMQTAKLLQDRAVGVVGLSPVVPLINNSYFKLMAIQQRSLYYIARHVPKLLPLVIRATVAKVDSGFDEEWLTSHFAESPLDLALMKNCQMKALARQGFTLLYMNGIEGSVRDFTQTGRKWQTLFGDYTGPVHMITGKETGQFSPPILNDLAERYENIKVTSVEQAAYFVAHQQTARVFELIDEQFNK
jgi:pimeloyl-ACP methyl ester carboxylesterase/DNA-binding CsgD family transcriptional regulator